jgi:hypothetical protein
VSQCWGLCVCECVCGGGGAHAKGPRLLGTTACLWPQPGTVVIPMRHMGVKASVVANGLSVHIACLPCVAMAQRRTALLCVTASMPVSESILVH